MFGESFVSLKEACNTRSEVLFHFVREIDKTADQKEAALHHCAAEINSMVRVISVKCRGLAATHTNAFWPGNRPSTVIALSWLGSGVTTELSHSQKPSDLMWHREGIRREGDGADRRTHELV